MSENNPPATSPSGPALESLSLSVATLSNSKNTSSAVCPEPIHLYPAAKFQTSCAAAVQLDTNNLIMTFDEFCTLFYQNRKRFRFPAAGNNNNNCSFLELSKLEEQTGCDSSTRKPFKPVDEIINIFEGTQYKNSINGTWTPEDRVQMYKSILSSMHVNNFNKRLSALTICEIEELMSLNSEYDTIAMQIGLQLYCDAFGSDMPPAYVTLNIFVENKYYENTAVPCNSSATGQNES